MTTTIFQLIGGPWDGQVLSTAADEEANACFAAAMVALTGGQIGASIPLVSPAGKERIDKGVNERERRAIRPHTYRIVANDRREGAVYVTARHTP